MIEVAPIWAKVIVWTVACAVMALGIAATSLHIQLTQSWRCVGIPSEQQTANAGTPKRFELYALATEKEAFHIQIGRQATVRFDRNPSLKLHAIVTEIGPSIATPEAIQFLFDGFVKPSSPSVLIKYECTIEPSSPSGVPSGKAFGIITMPTERIRPIKFVFQGQVTP
jgi:hypothetical protein